MLDTKILSLIKVAETGNYTQASKALNVTQPAISQHIRALEDELGVTIFERIDNRNVLTKEGGVVLSYAYQMLSLERNLKQELEGRISGIKTLTIGITHTMESNIIAQVLAKMVSTYQDLKVSLIADSQDALVDRVGRLELDFAIVDGKVTADNLKSMKMDNDRLMLIVAPEHPLAGKEVVSLKEIMKENMILRPPHTGTRDLFDSSLESRNIRPEELHIIMEVDNIATIKDLIRHGYGVSVLAESACMDELSKGKIAALPIEHLGMDREINIVYTRSFRYEGFLEEMVRTYNEMPEMH